MSIISEKLGAFRTGVVNFGAGLVQGAKNAGQGAVNGVKAAGRFMVSPDSQKGVEEAFRNGVNTAYSRINGFLKDANEVMEREVSGPRLFKGPVLIKGSRVLGGIEVLRTPIAKMQNFSLPRFQIDEQLEGNNKTLKKVANAMCTFHEQVVRKGELVSRVAGDTTHGLLRAALTPIRFLFKLVNLESVGALIQNSVALAVAFAVRGLVLGLSQLGHIVPYVVAAAIIGATVLGIAALAIKVSPLVAVIVAVGLIFALQQAQIISLGKKVDNLTNTLTQERRQAAQNTVGQRAKRGLIAIASTVGSAVRATATTTKAHKGKIAFAIALGSALVGGYFFGSRAAAAAAPVAEPVLAKGSELLKTLTDRAAGLFTRFFSTVEGTCAVEPPVCDINGEAVEFFQNGITPIPNLAITAS